MKRFLFDERKQSKARDEDVALVIVELIKAYTKEKLENLLLGLMTPKEVEEFAERIRIVQLLKKGVSQQDIAGKLGVGVATVSRGSKEIKMGNFITI